MAMHQRLASSQSVPSFLSASTCKQCRKRSGNFRALAVATDAMLRVYKRSDLSDPEVRKLLQRPRIDFASIMDTVCILSVTKLYGMGYSSWGGSHACTAPAGEHPWQ